MTSNQSGLPKLRFPGFTEPWEQRKLRNLLNKNSEKNKKLSVLNVESVSNKTGFTKQTEQFEDYSVASADLSNYYVIREQQFAYNPSRINVGSIAYKSLGDDISVVSPLYVSFSTKKALDDGFLWNWFKTTSFDAQRQRLSEGGVRDTLSFNQLSEMAIIFPKYSEQQKIGSFFQQLDHLITLHQRKLADLKAQKKGLLQKMFPQNNEDVPEIRFSGFTGAWEQRKLGTIVEFFSGLTYSPDNIVPEDGTFVLRSSNVKGGELVNADNVYVDSSVVNSSNVQTGDIVVVVRNGSRDLIGKHAQVKTDMENTVIGAFMTGIRSKESNFINALLDTQQFKIEINKNLGATINQITTGAFKKMLFSVTPNIEEQQKIGSFFKQLDNTIALHQRKLEHLQLQKKGLLQQMFV